MVLRFCACNILFSEFDHRDNRARLLSETGVPCHSLDVRGCYSPVIARSNILRGPMRRREFITLLGSTAAAWPLPSRAQQRKAMPRVGVLWHAANAKQEEEYLGALTKAFQDVGYLDGKNIELIHRFPAEQPERFRAFAQELAESKVDVIVAVTGFGAKEAKRATGTIPIVVVADPDPIGNGLVESLAHPGGNVTGLSPDDHRRLWQAASAFQANCSEGDPASPRD